jgi:hypothetical protein
MENQGMNVNKNSFIYILFLIMFSSFQCNMGGTSETGNARTASVRGNVVTDTSSLTTTLVRLVNADYIPGTRAIDKVFLTVPESKGVYSFDSIPWGDYYIYIKEGTTALLRGPVNISYPDIEIGKDVLFKTAKVALDIPENAGFDFVYVQGTVEEYRIDSGFVVLDVPSGQISIIGASDTIKNQSSQPDSLSGVQNLTITVAENDSIRTSISNLPPIITSTAKELDTSIVAGTMYLDTLYATDPEHDPVRFKLTLSPPLMTIDTISGIISWSVSPTIQDTVFTIKASASDNKAGVRTIQWNIRVVPQPKTIPAPLGVSTGNVAMVYLFSVDTLYQNDSAVFRFSWGDGDTSKWSTEPTSQHAWNSPGTYSVRFQLRTFSDSLSSWSEQHTIKINQVYPSGVLSSDSALTGDTISLKISNCYCSDSSQPVYILYWGDGDTIVQRTDIVKHLYKSPGLYYVSARFFCDSASASYNGYFAIDSIKIISNSNSDITPPVLTLSGSDSMSIDSGTVFVDPGYTANDNIDGNITSKVVVTGMVNSLIPGTYVKLYSVTDIAGNKTSMTRIITVKHSDENTLIPPPIGPDSGITGISYLFATDSTLYSDTAAFRFSWGDNDTSAWTTRSSASHTWNSAGVYEVKVQLWNLAGTFSNWSKPHSLKIVSTQNSSPLGKLSKNSAYVLDTIFLQIFNCLCSDSSNSPSYIVDWGNNDSVYLSTDSVIPYSYSVAGTYIVNAYYKCDSNTVLNPVSVVIDTITIKTRSQVDTIPPVLTLTNSDTVIVIDSGTAYVEPGYSALDETDGDITSLVVITNPVNSSIPGTYEIEYRATDMAGNSTFRYRRVVVR